MAQPRAPAKACRAVKPSPDPKVLLTRLRTRLDTERAALDRWQKRLVRAFHAFARQHRVVARLQRRITRLEYA